MEMTIRLHIEAANYVAARTKHTHRCTCTQLKHQRKIFEVPIMKRTLRRVIIIIIIKKANATHKGSLPVCILLFSVFFFCIPAIYENIKSVKLIKFKTVRQGGLGFQGFDDLITYTARKVNKCQPTEGPAVTLVCCLAAVVHFINIQQVLKSLFLWVGSLELLLQTFLISTSRLSNDQISVQKKKLRKNKKTK